jgi:mannose-6-phosphate isomerase-like protein (cupin superfamily)
MNAFALDATYVQLTDDGRAATILVEADFWTRLDERPALHAGRLLCAFDVARGEGDHSEMHPAGDEILICIAGVIEIVIDDEVVALGAGDACVVPRGTWHRIRSARGGRMISLTPGEGTLSRERNAVPGRSRL